MAKIQVAKIPVSETPLNKRELWARIAYYYPSYTLKKASKLPARDIALMLKVAKKVEAEWMYQLTNIAAAPHTEKGKGVKQLNENYKRMIDG